MNFALIFNSSLLPSLSCSNDSKSFLRSDFNYKTECCKKQTNKKLFLLCLSLNSRWVIILHRIISSLETGSQKKEPVLLEGPLWREFHSKPSDQLLLWIPVHKGCVSVCVFVSKRGWRRIKIFQIQFTPYLI